MKKRKFVGVLMAFTMLFTLTGAYAYFTDKEVGKGIIASSASFSIHVDGDPFQETPKTFENLVPGDEQDLSYSVRNDSSVPAKVHTLITVTISKPITDELQWKIISNDTKNPETGEAIEKDGQFYVKAGENENQGTKALEDGKLYLLSNDTIDGKTVIRYIIDHKVIAAGVRDDVSLKLKFSENAENMYKNTSCTVDAVVYAIQDKYTDKLSFDQIHEMADPNVENG